jgi:NTE family protein
MLINRGYKDIIIVRIFGVGLEKPIKIPRDVNITQIAPRIDLGGILEFDCKKSTRNIKIGYYDGLRSLCNLKGKIYYIESKYSEEDYLERLCHVKEAAKMVLLEYYHLDYSNERIYTRKFIEQVCPRLAATLRIRKDWNYEDLYIGLLELCAKSLKIQKYKVYTLEELTSLIQNKYKSDLNKGQQSVLFHELILKMITI